MEATVRPHGRLLAHLLHTLQMPAHLTVITGGARSGKSTFAEQLVTRLAGDDVTYVATAEALDDEMMARVAEHRASRNPSWETVEAPLDAATAIRRARHDVVLLDCLTLLTSNHLLSDGEGAALAAITDLLRAWRESGKTVVLVTNEVGWSIVPANPLARRFRDLQGRVNRLAMDAASTGYLIVAGQLLRLKGEQ